MPVPVFTSDELPVNTTTEDDQDKSSVTALANGKFVVIWEDSSTTGGDTSSDAVRGQVFNADGSKAGGEFLVNQTTANGQILPVVTGLTDGRFVVAWEDASATGGDTSESAIRARIFNVNGAPAGDEFLVNTTTTNDQFEPAIAALAGGGFVVTWTHEFSGTDLDVRGRAFDATGAALGNDFTVDQTAANDETESAVLGLQNGNYVVVWQDEGDIDGATDGSGSHLRAAVMSGNGTVVVPEFIVNTTAENDQSQPAIALLSDGNFIVTWTSGDFLSPSSTDVRGRVFSPTGVPLGLDFLIDGDGGDEFDSSVSALADGAYAVAWTNNSNPDAETDGSANHARAVLLAGNAGAGVSDEFVVNTTTNGAQNQPSLATLADGRLVATWSDFGGNLGDDDHAVRAQIIDPRTEDVELFGTGLGDDFVGTDFNDFMDGRAGNDRLDGADGNDTLKGSEGADSLIGGDGRDTASFNSSTAGVTVSLTTGFAAGGDAEDDVLVSIENLNGSTLDDELIGDDGVNELDGLDGNDRLIGRGGNDTLDGGEGNDLLAGGQGADRMLGGSGDDLYFVDDPGDRVIEDAGEGIDAVLTAISFTLPANVEILELDDDSGTINATGNGLANVLTGNASANILDGEGGADTMRGGRGNDTYVLDNAGDEVIEEAGEGVDTVNASVSFILDANFENLTLIGAANINATGNALANVLNGNAGDNVLDGKGGADTMAGGKGNDTYVVDTIGDEVIEKAGEGVDTVISSVAFVLGAEIENLELVGLADNVAKTTATGLNATGNALANTITGNDGANLMDGGAGDDILRGRGGRDKLIGGDGDDRLSGDLGRDKLIAGKGDDNFVFDAALGKINADRISGFKVKDDTLLLDDAIFNGLDVGDLKKKAYFEGDAAHDNSDRVILTDKGRLLFDADGKGGDKALLFAKLGKDADLSQNDFLVI